MARKTKEATPREILLFWREQEEYLKRKIGYLQAIKNPTKQIIQEIKKTTADLKSLEKEVEEINQEI